MKSVTITATTSDIDPAFLEQLQQLPSIEDVINALTQEAILAFEAGNVYVGEFGRNIIHEAVRKAVVYRVAAL